MSPKEKKYTERIAVFFTKEQLEQVRAELAQAFARLSAEQLAAGPGFLGSVQLYKAQPLPAPSFPISPPCKEHRAEQIRSPSKAKP